MVAEHKVQTAIEAGLFEALPERGEVDCALRGESFLIWWFRMHYGSGALADTHD